MTTRRWPIYTQYHVEGLQAGLNRLPYTPPPAVPKERHTDRKTGLDKRNYTPPNPTRKQRKREGKISGQGVSKWSK